jgi:hypothetical protein
MKPLIIIFNITVSINPCQCGDNENRFQAFAVYEDTWGIILRGGAEKDGYFIDFVSK